MNEVRTRSHRGVIRSARWLAVVMFMCVYPGQAAWSLPESLSGSIQINGVDGENDGQHQSSLNQRYSLHWSKRLVPYLTARASVSYDRFGTDSDLSGSAWRQQVQPVAELGWSHPLFSATATYRRRESSSQDESTSLVRNSVGVSVRTRDTRYPIVSLRLDNDETYNKLNRQDRDTRERRIQAGLSYNVSDHSFYYNFTNRDDDIRSSGVGINESTHLIRWDQTTRLLHDKLRLTTGYNFSHRRQVTETSSGTTAYRPIAVVSALQGVDASPDFGSLDSLRTLADGNISDPALPFVDIGQDVTDQNIGVDFGFARDVEGLYIYTDRPSGNGVTWTVYLSSDNLTWEPMVASASVAFNTSFSRYEILFDAVKTRYIKAVSGGLNSEITVYVTEIEAIETESDTAKNTRTQSTHQASLAVSYQMTDHLGSTVDLHYRGEPSGDFSDRRDQFFYGTSLRFTPTSVIAQTASYQGSRESFSAGKSRLTTHAVTYAATVTPLETLEFTFSAVSRHNYENELKQLETNGALLRTTGEVLRNLRVTIDAGVTRTNQPQDRLRFDSWTYQTSVDAGITRSLDAVVTYLYQDNREVGGSPLRIRRQVTANANYRLTRSILLRGTVTRNVDESRQSTYQEYSGVWRLSSRLSFSALANINESSGDIRSQRDNLLLNYKVSNSTSASFSYSDIETGTGTKSHSFQVGLRSGF